MPSLKSRNRPGILLVGKFLSGSVGNRGVCEDPCGCSRDFRLVSAHDLISPWSSCTDIRLSSDCLATTPHLYLAHVDVYSGLAFVWAELVCWALRMLKKPYVLTLHGGNLPVFARRSDQRVRRLLQSSSAVTAPSRYLLEQMRQYRQDMSSFAKPIGSG